MPANQAYDNLELQDMVLPYAPNAGPLIDKPYLASGSNTYVTWGGTLKKRPGNANVGVAAVSGVYPERLWVYETLEASPVVYVVGSFKNSGVYELRYTKVSSLGNWTLASERRGSNHSVYPHEGDVRRGKLYIKGFPGHLVDAAQLGSIYLDGTGGSMATHDWGALGPQTAVAVSAPGGWGASAHNVTVLNSWIYTYTYQKVSGQETDSAPLQTNPDLSPSSTGAFTNKIPNMTVQGLADTAEYPYINMYRTTDGGGSFFFLYQITNTGAGAITFNDTHLASGGGGATFQDPLPDANLNTAHQAPSQTSNGPPPTVAPPSVTGTDDIQRCSRIVQYASRLWYAVNEYIFFSANEELDEGVPEESFPSGLATPNFFRMNQGVTNLIPTPDGLLVMTRKDTTLIYGTNKATFNPRPFLGNIGGAPGQPRAACEASEYQAWLMQDYSVALAHGNQFAVLSFPLATAIKDAAAAGADIDMKFWKQGDKEYLVVGAMRKDDTTLTRYYIYDLDRARRVQDNFWFTPWAVTSTALAVGASSASDTENKLYSAFWDGTNFLLEKLDPTGALATDINPTSGAVAGFGYSFRMASRQNPIGYHMNPLRRPNMSTICAAFQFERTTYADNITWAEMTMQWQQANQSWASFDLGIDPYVNAYVDDLGANTAVLLGFEVPPQRRLQSNGFRTSVLTNLQRPCKYVGIELVGTSTTHQFEMHKGSTAFLPDSGA